MRGSSLVSTTCPSPRILSVSVFLSLQKAKTGDVTPDEDYSQQGSNVKAEKVKLLLILILDTEFSYMT